MIEWVVVLAIVAVVFALMCPAGDFDFTHRFPQPTAPAITLARGAGDYYRGQGRGLNLSLRILPDGRYSYVWAGCTGVCERESGYARDISGWIVLYPTERNASRLSRVLLPVRWGPRAYLIPPEQMSAFCDEIAGGDEPRPGPHGTFFLADSTPPVSGVPTLPQEWAAYLDRRLVLGTVVAMVDDATARIDLGTDRGVRVGDAFAVQGWGRRGPRLLVTAVERDSCIARGRDPEEGEERLTVGRKVVSPRELE